VSDWSTNESRNTFTFEIGPGELEPGRYIVRLSYWSDAAYDHEYTLTMNITLDWGGNCSPDDNEDPEMALTIPYDTSVTDYVCGADHLDIWRFYVTDGAEGAGTVSLTVEPGELMFFLYNSSSEEIFSGRTTDGKLDYEFASSGEVLPEGSYFIGVLLPPARSEENEYKIELGTGYITFIPGILVFDFLRPDAPWPTKYGDARNTNRSYFPGPSYGMIRSFEYDNYELTLDEYRNPSRYFEGLLYGPDELLVFMEHPSNHIYGIRPDLPSNPYWVIFSGSEEMPCFDSDGLLYYINQGRDRLVCKNHHMGEVWDISLPSRSLPAVHMVGKYIYVSTGDNRHRRDLHVYDRQGEIYNHDDRNGMYMFTIMGLDGEIIGVAEDVNHGCFYVQTRRFLYKFDFEGSKLWEKELRFIGASRDDAPGGYLAPIIGNDSRVWVYTPRDRGWRVYNQNGTLYLHGNYEGRIFSACLGSNGHLYVTTRMSAYCYKEWIEEVWHKHLGPTVDDMIMDSKDNLYFAQLYTFRDRAGDRGERNDQYIYVVEPEEGRLEATFDGIGVDTDILDYINENRYLGIEHSYLAIGEDGQLALLHRSGLLQVFDPIMIAMGIYANFEWLDE